MDKTPCSPGLQTDFFSECGKSYKQELNQI